MTSSSVSPVVIVGCRLTSTPTRAQPGSLRSACQHETGWPNFAPPSGPGRGDPCWSTRSVIAPPSRWAPGGGTDPQVQLRQTQTASGPPSPWLVGSGVFAPARCACCPPLIRAPHRTSPIGHPWTRAGAGVDLWVLDAFFRLQLGNTVGGTRWMTGRTKTLLMRRTDVHGGSTSRRGVFDGCELCLRRLWVAECATNRAIADTLVVTLDTVKRLVTTSSRGSGRPTGRRRSRWPATSACCAEDSTFG
jgi:hypothetical protein